MSERTVFAFFVGAAVPTALSVAHEIAAIPTLHRHRSGLSRWLIISARDRQIGAEKEHDIPIVTIQNRDMQSATVCRPRQAHRLTMPARCALIVEARNRVAYQNTIGGSPSSFALPRGLVIRALITGSVFLAAMCHHIGPFAVQISVTAARTLIHPLAVAGLEPNDRFRAVHTLIANRV